MTSESIDMTERTIDNRKNTQKKRVASIDAGAEFIHERRLMLEKRRRPIASLINGESLSSQIRRKLPWMHYHPPIKMIEKKGEDEKNTIEIGTLSISDNKKSLHLPKIKEFQSQDSCRAKRTKKAICALRAARRNLDIAIDFFPNSETLTPSKISNRGLAKVYIAPLPNIPSVEHSSPSVLSSFLGNRSRRAFAAFDLRALRSKNGTNVSQKSNTIIME